MITIDDGDLNFSIGPGGWESDTTCSPPHASACPYWYWQTGDTHDYSGQNGDSFYTYDEDQQADYWAEWNAPITAITQGWYNITVFVCQDVMQCAVWDTFIE